MRLRDSVALTLPSLLLRLVLGITFLWAGCGKLLGTFEVSGGDAARLANLGVVLTDAPPDNDATDGVPPRSGADTPPPPPSEPLESLPGADEPDPEPELPPENDQPTSDDPELRSQADEIINTIKDRVKDGSPAEPAPESESQTEPAADPAADPALGEPIVKLSRVQHTASRYASSDFPDPVEVRRVYSVALTISKAADPGLTDDSQPIPATMPAGLGDDPWPIVLAWATAITELLAGGLLVIGLLTRISAMGLFVLMLVAMWTTEIGPAALQSGDAILGFIPNHPDVWAPQAYTVLLWQLALASMALAVVFLGSGVIGLDRLFFGATPRDPYLHGDPKAARPAARPGKGPQPVQGPPRSEFDRSPNPTP